MAPARTAMLRLYDALARDVPLDLATNKPHLPGCDGTLRHAHLWINEHERGDITLWQKWLRAMCIDCDCALLLQMTTMSSENGALEGINVRRCSSCNALLALYQVARAPGVVDSELLSWAAEAGVPAYLVTIISPDQPDKAQVQKVFPEGATFPLTARQFYVSVLRQLELQHACVEWGDDDYRADQRHTYRA